MRRWLWGSVLVGVALLAVAAMWPTRRRVGMNYVLREERIPLARKAYDFVSRDLRARRLTRSIFTDMDVSSPAAQETRLVTLLQWIRAHVAPMSEDLVAIDDHVIDIIERGYGAPDQRAEAFALLATHLGHPAGHVIVRLPNLRRGRHLSVVRLGDRLHVFDVEAGVTCRDPSSGALLDLKQLRADAPLVERACGGIAPEGRPFVEWLRALDENHIGFFRMDAQHPARRLRIELGRLWSR